MPVDQSVILAPPQVDVPEVEATPLLTLMAGGFGGWAALSADGRTYKADGDVHDVLWWTIKTARFEAGELDRYDPTIRRLDPEAAMI